MTEDKKGQQPRISPGSKKDKKTNSELANEIGKRLKKIRLENTWTQEVMVEKLGVERNFYGRIERGESRMSLERLVLIRKNVHIDLNFLLTGQEMAETILDLQDIPEEKRQYIETILKCAKFLAADEKK